MYYASRCLGGVPNLNIRSWSLDITAFAGDVASERRVATVKLFIQLRDD